MAVFPSTAKTIFTVEVIIKTLKVTEYSFMLMWSETKNVLTRKHFSFSLQK